METMQPRSPRAVAQLAALALAERALKGRSTAGLDGYRTLLRCLEQGRPVDDATSGLVDQALGVWARPGFETFVSLPRLRFEPFGYQLQAARSVLRAMRSRAILADEVGLGKTIEAALVASELRLRGLAAQTLILVPVGLVEQWQEELDRKFGLPSVLAQRGGFEHATRAAEQPLVIASLASARRAPLRDAIAETAWDLIIVDEAHRLKNPQSASARLVRGLRARYLVLLTATPVENRLEDLFQLVNLVRPGHMGTPREFRARYGAARASIEPARNLAALQARMREVMVRHRRSELASMLPRRLAETLCVQPGVEEAELYQMVSARVRASGRGAAPARKLALRSVQRLAGSSPRALVPSLEKLGWPDLARLAEKVDRTEKGRVLVELLRRHQAAGDKVVVFTAFRQTLGFLADLAAAAGLSAVAYHGGLTRQEKDRAVRSFREELGVLLTTEAAGEGRNLQFCHVMVNFDLPWNPMQIEQRLGRIHRIGQDHEVLLTNLVTRGTVEERILRVLEAKINLFELVVGELDMILGRIEEDFDFEHFVFDAHLASGDDAEFQARLDALGDDLVRARRDHADSRERTDQLIAPSEP
jgi:SNF2 family DNA or RNA helicase